MPEWLNRADSGHSLTRYGTAGDAPGPPELRRQSLPHAGMGHSLAVTAGAA